MKNNFWIEKIVIPLVKIALQHLNVKNESDIKELIASEISKRNLRSESEIESLMDSKMKQLNEANGVDFDDRETNLKEYLTEGLTTVEQLFTKQLEQVKLQIQSINRSIVTLRENNASVPSLLESLEKEVKKIESDYKTAVNKSRTDAAAVVKNTRDKLTDLDDKLDAFIDTISERLVSMKRSRT